MRAKASLVTTLAIAVTLLSSLTVHAIGRIGNNRWGDNNDRYSAPLLLDFKTVQNTNDGGLIFSSGLKSGLASLPGFVLDVDLQVSSFRSRFPLLVGVESEKIQTYFLSSTETVYQSVSSRDTHQDFLGFLGEGEDTYVGVAVCPDGRGYVVHSPKVKLSKNAIRKLIEETKFVGPCLK